MQKTVFTIVLFFLNEIKALCFCPPTVLLFRWLPKHDLTSNKCFPLLFTRCCGWRGGLAGLWCWSISVLRHPDENVWAAGEGRALHPQQSCGNPDLRLLRALTKQSSPVRWVFTLERAQHAKHSQWYAQSGDEVSHVPHLNRLTREK